MKQISSEKSALRIGILKKVLMTLAVIFFGPTIAAATTSIPEDYRVEPAPGTTLESITHITVVNTEGDEIMNYGNKIKINGADYTTSPKVDWNKVTFTLETPITKSGDYEIIIPKGRIQDEYWDDIDEFRFTLVVKSADTPDEPCTTDAIIPKGFTVTPAPGSEVTSISEIKLTYDDDFTDLSLVKKVIKIDGDEVPVNGYGDWGELTITLITKITEEGEHAVVIPAGTFTLDSMDDNEEFRFALVVKGGEGPDEPENPDQPGDELAGIPSGFTVTPGKDAEIEKLTVITIVDDNYGDMAVNSDAKMYIDGKPVEYSAEVSGEYDDTLTITLADTISEEGEHTIQLPAGFFNYMVTSPCKEFGWKVTVKSVENPVPEPETTLIPDGVGVSPEPGSKIPELTEVIVSAEGWGDLYYMSLNHIYVNGEEKSVKEGYGNPLKIELNDKITADGTYWITIPAKSIMNDFGKEIAEPIQFSVIVDALSAVDEMRDGKESDEEIYTVEGLKVDKMQPGNIYIIRKGAAVTKKLAK